MRQFLAILKDSFREAVDGFVIYLMAAFSSLLILLLASVSFEANDPEQALPKLTSKFAIIFPDRGASMSPTGDPGFIDYRAEETKKLNGSSVAFTLKVSPNAREDASKAAEAKQVEPAKKNVENPKRKPEADTFRYAVVAWQKPAGEKLVNPFGERGQNKNRGKSEELEIVKPPQVTAEELRNVTDEEMTAFLKYQFVTFVGVAESDVSVKRRRDVEEPEYKFDVELKSISGARGWPHAMYIFFGATRLFESVPLGAVVYGIEDYLVGWVGASLALVMSVIITAFFIPNLLRKGSIDLLVSKPIGRSQLLIYKYLGGLTFISLISGLTIGGVWLALAIRSGIWDPGFLVSIPLLMFTFSVLYAMSTLVAVFTRSAIASILLTLLFMGLMYGVGKTKEFFDVNKIVHVVDLPEWSYTLVDTLNNGLPRLKDLDKLTTKLIVDGNMTSGDARLSRIFTEYPSWSGPVFVSLLYIAILMGLACWRFTKRDY